MGKTDVPVGIALDNWRSSSSAATEDAHELAVAYKAFADSVESRVTDERDKKKPQKNTAPAVETARVPQRHEKQKSKGEVVRRAAAAVVAMAAAVVRRRSHSRVTVTYCTFNKALCGNWRHGADDCFCNP